MRKLLFASLLTISTFACGSSTKTSQPTTASTPAHAEHQADQCPMKEMMAGTKVTATDTADGAAIEFTTTGDPAALRAHVHQMADMHNGMAMHHDGDMHGGMGSGGMHDMHGGMGSGGMHDMHGGMGSGMHDMHEMKMVPSQATVEDLPNGARIVLVPKDAAQLADLRTHVREHAAMMAKGECPMMGHGQPAPTDDHAGHHPPG